MTIIEMKKDSIYIHGHSGYDVVGKDIVCAAISTLSDATYKYLEVTGNEVRYLGGDGVLTIYLDKLNDTGEKIISGFRDMCLELSEQYPKYIEMRK